MRWAATAATRPEDTKIVLEAERQHLKARTLVGIGWVSAGRFLGLILQFVSNTVVARNLSSADIGLVGFGYILTGFLTRLTNPGFDNAVVRRQNLDSHILATAFSLQATLGVGAFLATAAVAPLSALLLGDKASTGVVLVLGTTLVLGTLGFAPSCLLTRELRYGRLTAAGTGRAVSRCALLVGLIWLGFGYWSLVLAEVGAIVVFVAGLNLLRPTAYAWRWDTAVVKELVQFGMPVLGSNLLVFLVFNADNFVIGTALGTAQLGYYALAFSWGSLVAVTLWEIIHAVLFPVFAKLHADIVATKRLYLRTLEAAGFLAVLANSCVLSMSHEFVVLLLGKGTGKWLPALRCLEILTIYGMVRALTEPVANVVLASGHTRIILIATLLAAGLEISPIWWVARYYGINGVALLVILAYCAQIAVYFPFLRQEFAIRVADIAHIVLPLAAASGVAVFVTRTVVAGGGEPSWMYFAIGVLVTAVVLTLVHGVLTSFKTLYEVRDLFSWILKGSASRSGTPA
jgi:lipopolysaccharide exporter